MAEGRSCNNHPLEQSPCHCRERSALSRAGSGFTGATGVRESSLPSGVQRFPSHLPQVKKQENGAGERRVDDLEAESEAYDGNGGVLCPFRKTESHPALQLAALNGPGSQDQGRGLQAQRSWSHGKG